jgi:hypothetical protein
MTNNATATSSADTAVSTDTLLPREDVMVPTSEVLASASVKPALTAYEMAESFLAYKKMQEAIDHAMPESILRIGDTKFRKKGYWRALRAAFNLTVECIFEERVEVTNMEGEVDWGWNVRYRATATNGSFIDGDGTCYASEKNKGAMRATEHNVRSHAHTRAQNRAISSLVGFGEVSADETEYDELRETSGAVITEQPHRTPDTYTQQAPSSNGRTSTKRYADGNHPSAKEGTRLISEKQSGLLAARMSANNINPLVLGEKLEDTFGSKDPLQIPFSEFQDILKWIDANNPNTNG